MYLRWIVAICTYVHMHIPVCCVQAQCSSPDGIIGESPIDMWQSSRLNQATRDIIFAKFRQVAVILLVKLISSPLKRRHITHVLLPLIFPRS